MSDWLVDPTQRILASALDGLTLREQAVAANLSNIDTPGYQAETVDFETELQAQLSDALDGGGMALNDPTLGTSAALGLARTTAAHFGGAATADSALGAASLDSRSLANAQRVDGNTVSVDEEMTALADTQLKYASVSRMITDKLGMLKDVVNAR
jgi:flagellar basal-body rod protein FlgB